MKWTISYYYEETKREDVEHLLDEDITEESIQEYLKNCWSACIPEVPTSGKGATKEEAKQDAIKAAYDATALYLKLGQVKAEEYTNLTIEDSDEQPSSLELVKMGPAWFKIPQEEARAAE